MAEYIDKADLVKRLESRIKDYGRDCNSNAPIISRTYQAVLHMVENLPTADVVPVVRCKDCVYWEGRGYDGRCEAYKNGLIRDYTNYDDYCSYGERRDKNEQEQSKNQIG